MSEALEKCNDILRNILNSLISTTTQTGMINVDFSDIKRILLKKGDAIIGSGTASGQNKIETAINQAVTNPLLKVKDISGASGVLLNIITGPDFNMEQVSDIGRIIEGMASESADIIFGVVIEDGYIDRVDVMVLATGILV